MQPTPSIPDMSAAIRDGSAVQIGLGVIWYPAQFTEATHCHLAQRTVSGTVSRLRFSNQRRRIRAPGVLRSSAPGQSRR